MPKARDFGSIKYPDNPRLTAQYLNDAFESEDRSVITNAIGKLARARGMAFVAKQARVILASRALSIRDLIARPS
jgi:probable addiction module antidote protein